MAKRKYVKVTRMTINGREIGLAPHEQEFLRKSIDKAILDADRKYTQTANVPTMGDVSMSITGTANEMPSWFADLFRIRLPPKALFYRHPAIEKGKPIVYMDDAYNVAYINPEDFDALSKSTGIVESSSFEYDQFLKHTHEKRTKGIVGDFYFGENSPK